MNLRKKCKTLIGILASLLLSSCDTFQEKDPLPGTRESIIVLDEALQPDPVLLHQKINIGSAVKNKDWPQVGGSASHVMPPLALGQDLKVVLQKNIGLGSNEGQKLISGPIVVNGCVYAMDAGGIVNAIDVTKQEILWTQTTATENEPADALGGGLAYEEGMLYATTSFGEVIALNPKDGKIIWRKSIGTPIRSAPTVKDGRLYTVTINNELHTLNTKTGESLWMHSGITEPAILLGGSNPAVTSNAVVVTYSSGEIYALHVENGHPLWSDILTSALRVDSVTSIPHIRARPIIDGNFVYVISHGGRMTAIDMQTGIRAWQKDVGGTRTPAVIGDSIFVLTNQGDVMCLKKDTGQVHWAAALPKLTEDKEPIFWAGPVVAGDALLFTSSKGEVKFLSPQDGKTLKSLKFEGSSYLSAVIADSTLFVLTDNADLIAWR